MGKGTVVDLSARGGGDELTELIRSGARELIARALEAELEELLAGFGGQQDDQGRSRVVRNGYQPQREIQTGIGPVTVKVPKVRSRTGDAVSFRSALVPPYRAQEPTGGSGAAVAVSEGHFERGDALGAGGVARATSERPIGQYGVAAEATVARGVRGLARPASGS